MGAFKNFINKKKAEWRENREFEQDVKRAEKQAYYEAKKKEQVRTAGMIARIEADERVKRFQAKYNKPKTGDAMFGKDLFGVFGNMGVAKPNNNIFGNIGVFNKPKRGRK